MHELVRHPLYFYLYGGGICLILATNLVISKTYVLRCIRYKNNLYICIVNYVTKAKCTLWTGPI